VNPRLRSSDVARPRTIRVAVRRTLLAVALWWVLVEGDHGGVAVAMMVVLAAAATSIILLPAGRTPRISLVGLARFVPFFLIQSARGGLDVARRALDPRLPLQPGYLEHETSLPEGLPRFVFTGAVSLFPGTLAVAPGKEVRHADRLRVHVLDRRLPLAETLANLEMHVSRMFP
jgi:multicomponent Na+:H+ antiporter subunit E